MVEFPDKILSFIINTDIKIKNNLVNYSEVTMSVQHEKTEKKYKKFFKSFQSPEVEVTKVTEEKIIFKLVQNQAENLKILREKLSSKDNLRKNVLHAISTDEKMPKSNTEINFDTFEVEFKNFFQKIVSENYIKQYNLQGIFAMEHSIQYNEEFLTTEVRLQFDDPLLYEYGHSNLKMLQAAISDESKVSAILRREEPKVDKYTYPLTEFAKLIISSIEPDPNNNAIKFILNNGVITQALQAYDESFTEPPVIAYDLNEAFIIDKQYLLKYLSEIFNSLVYAESENFFIVFDAKDKARDEKFINKNITHNITILIDTSFSMKDQFETYISNIEQILDHLGKIFNWQIDIFQFDTTTTRKSFTSICNTIDEVKNYVRRFTADGSTRLYCTMIEALRELYEKFTKEKDFYSTMITFTDGVNYGGCTEWGVQTLAANLTKNSEITTRFNMYTVGFGSGYNTKFFEDLSKTTGCLHVNLINSDGMGDLEQYIENIDYNMGY